MTLTREDFQKFAPRPKSEHQGKLWDAYVEGFIEHGEALAQEHGVDEAAEWHGFIANVAHECGGFSIWRESMNYRAERIMEIFGVGRHTAAITYEEAEALAGNQPALAERVYGLGNPRKAAELGNSELGDGWAARGLGHLQATGAEDHMRFFGRKDGNVTMEQSLKAAFQEWEEKKGNDLCRAGDFSKACRAVNGGTNGMKDRHAWHAKAKKVWPNLPFEHGAGDAVVETKPLIKSETAQGGAAVVGGSMLATYGVVTEGVNKVAAAEASFMWKAWMLMSDVTVIGAIVALAAGLFTIYHRYGKDDVEGFLRTPTQ